MKTKTKTKTKKVFDFICGMIIIFMSLYILFGIITILENLIK